MNDDIPGRHEHAHLIRRTEHDSEETVQEGSLTGMAEALFSLPRDERGFYVVETIEGRFEEHDLIARLQSGELEG